MNIIELIDLKVTPDIIHEYNADKLKAENATIIVDNGAYKCRVGWSNKSTPLLEFRNLIAKPRKDRKKDSAEVVANPPIQIGNDITNIETVRLLLKTQFDRNVVVHFHNQEQIFDYSFMHLGIDSDGNVPHNMLITETLGNPIYCRQQMNELLFEGYGVPGVCWGIDSLFSWWHNRNENEGSDALVISFGYHTTHIIPILDGNIQFENIRRLNVGGFHIITYLHRLMQMKYPQHINAITISRMEMMLHEHSHIVVDYQNALKNWAETDYYIENVKKIQLPYTATALQTSTQREEQKLERRKELSRRLIESNARRAREKMQDDEEQLEIMGNIRALYEDGEMDEFRQALKQNKLKNLQELDKLITMVHNRMERAKLKALQNSVTENATAILKDTNSSVTVSTKTTIKPPTDMPMDQWLEEVKSKRSELIKQKTNRKNRRQELAKRHTAAAQERMRIISQLARNEKGSDEFGMNDQDWDVYKVINRDNDSESEVENEKLNEYNTILQQYDPTFDDSNAGGSMSDVCAAELHQLHVGVETIRAPEILFQPSMIGSSEAGLAELVDYVLKLFPPQEQQRLADNVYLTGGCAQFRGLKDRLSKELLEMRPFQTTHSIRIADNPSNDAWLGACEFAKQETFQSALTTKQDFEENGSEYFRTHRASNLYYPMQK